MEKLKNAIVVGVSHVKDGERWTLSGDSASTLAYAKMLTDGPVIAVSVVPECDLEAIRACGIGTVYAPMEVGASLRLSDNAAIVAGQAIKEIQDTQDIAAVFLPNTKRGRETAGRLAVRMGGGVTTDVSDIQVVDGKLEATKRVLGGEWETKTSLQDGIPIFTLSLGSEPETPEVFTCTPDIVRVAVDGLVSSRLRLVRARQQPGGANGDLRDSDVVVVGGRGVDGDFDTVHWLADVLSGAVGATRVACDEGWAPRSMQIGQTGVSISPKIYVGLGVSGAVHHTCGIQGSDVIVAVCDDPDAPIFEMADFGVVGDVAEVVPQAIKRLEELKSER